VFPWIPNCLKEISSGNFSKHHNWCIGKGKDKHNCVVCNKLYYVWSKIKTCSDKCLSEHQSNRMKKLYSEGFKIPYGGSGNRKIYNSILHGNIPVMSSYEYDACEIFDIWYNVGKIKYWEYTRDKFSYLDEIGTKRTYFPDFKIFNLDGSYYYIETKGFNRQAQEVCDLFRVAVELRSLL
jgi:hypothetical protein